MNITNTNNENRPFHQAYNCPFKGFELLGSLFVANFCLLSLIEYRLCGEHHDSSLEGRKVTTANNLALQKLLVQQRREEFGLTEPNSLKEEY